MLSEGTLAHVQTFKGTQSRLLHAPVPSARGLLRAPAPPARVTPDLAGGEDGERDSHASPALPAKPRQLRTAQPRPAPGARSWCPAPT